MITVLFASVGLLVLFVLCPLIWLCRLLPAYDPVDRAVLAPVVAILLFAVSTGIGQFVPWSFELHALATSLVLVASLAFVALPRVRDEVARSVRLAWGILVPAACCFLAVAAFGVVQGDPPRTVSYPGTLVSARVTNLPPDHLFAVGAAQILQHRTDPMTRDFFEFWDFADRTPLAGAVTATAALAIGGDLPERAIWRLPVAALAPVVPDDLGYWQAHLVLVLLNTLVVIAVARLARSIFGARAGIIAGFLAALNPFIFTNAFFTWPKMLAAFFVLLHYTYLRERRGALLCGGAAGLAYLSHPLALIFLVPSLVVSLGRLRAPRFNVLGAFVLTILPWQIWSALWAHPSRMLTYPLGYTIRHPDRLGDEVDKAFRLFREAGLGHALSVRWDSVVATVWPFDPARNFVTLPDVHLSSAEAWFTVHDRTIGGMLLFALIPALVIGFVVWHRRATYEWVWALVAPLVLAVGFWGIEPQGLGAALLQPTAAVLVALAAGGLVTGPYALSVVVGLVGILEAASVVWLGLFARSASATGFDVAIAVSIWSVPAIALAIVLVTEPRSRAREERARPRATIRPAREPAR